MGVQFMDTENREESYKASLELPANWWREQHTIHVLTEWFKRYLVGLFIEIQSDIQVDRVINIFARLGR